MTVLVVAGTDRGVTHKVAEVIAEALNGRGIEATLGEIDDLRRAEEFEAIVFGSEAEGGRWPSPAGDACRRHADVLTQHLVWLFSAPVEENSATRGEIDVPELVAALTARDHKYFADAEPHTIRSWVSFIADELEGNS